MFGSDPSAHSWRVKSAWVQSYDANAERMEVLMLISAGLVVHVSDLCTQARRFRRCVTTSQSKSSPASKQIKGEAANIVRYKYCKDPKANLDIKCHIPPSHVSLKMF